MKSLYDPAINRYRIISGKLINALDGATGNDKCGAFLIPYPATGVKIKVVASAGYMDWDHVSVTVDKKRPPNWQVMSFVKDFFFDPEVCAMQLHPPHSEYVNNHSACLHIWAPCKDIIPRPPSILVGVKELGTVM